MQINIEIFTTPKSFNNNNIFDVKTRLSVEKENKKHILKKYVFGSQTYHDPTFHCPNIGPNYLVQLFTWLSKHFSRVIV